MKVQKCRNPLKALYLLYLTSALLPFKSAAKVQAKVQEFIKNSLQALYLLDLHTELINFKSAGKSAGIKNLILHF